MKKLFRFLILISLLFTACTTVSADIKPCDLIFEPDRTGTFIYSNNPETIRRNTLTDVSNPTPTYIMNNDNLKSGNYTYFISHFNRTELKDTNGITEPGFDIEFDMQFQATADTEIALEPVGFETSHPQTKYMNGQEYRYQDTWCFLNAFATYKKMPIYTINSDLKYFPQNNTAHSITLKAGETVWLSQYIDNYRETSCGSAVFMMGKFEIKKGTCNVNIAALKSIGKLKDRSHHNNNAARGVYVNDKQYKGIADSDASVTVPLHYVVDDTTPSGKKLPVRIFNQYQPKGLITDTWTTHINPQADQWTKNSAAESDMLSFQYKDESKLNCYGTNISDNQKDSIWKFDVFHSDTKNYNGETSFSADNFIPNYTLQTTIDNLKTSCNLGNYGVAENYKITIENKGTKDRYFYYKLTTVSPNIVVIKDENGNPINDFAYCKGELSEKREDIMACVPLPKETEKTFTIEVTLPTNFYGGMSNSFEIADTPFENQFTQSNFVKLQQNYKHTGREYYKWYDKKLFVSNNAIDWKEQPLDTLTSSLFDSNWNNYELLYTNQGYMVRWNAYDGALGWFVSTQPKNNTVYFLDNEFHLTGSHDFDSYITKIAYALGHYYVQTTAKTYTSTNRVDWVETSIPIPIYNGSPYCYYVKDNVVYASTDSINYQKVSYLENQPVYIARMGNLYYYFKDNRMFISVNGIYWRYLQIDTNVQTAYKKNNTMVLNDTYEQEIPEMIQNIVVSLNGEILAFDKIPVMRNDRILVPMRYMFEKLGAEVTWDESTRTATMHKGDKTISFQIDNNIIDVNGVKKQIDTPPIEENWRTLIPIRFFSEELGLQVDWNNDIKLVTIHQPTQ